MVFIFPETEELFAQWRVVSYSLRTANKHFNVDDGRGFVKHKTHEFFSFLNPW